MRLGLLEPTQEPKHVAKIVVGRGEARIQLDGTSKRLEGIIRAPEALRSQAEGEPDHRIVGPNSKGGEGTLGGLLVAAVGQRYLGEAALDQRNIGPLLGCPAEQQHSALGISHLITQDAKQMQSTDVVRFLGEHRLIECILASTRKPARCLAMAASKSSAGGLARQLPPV